MSAHTCPVCAGRGTVPPGFYDGIRPIGGGRSTCRSCGGRGVILTESASSPTPEPDPTDLTYHPSD